MPKITQVHLSQLHTNFDVRRSLNDDHVYNLALLYEAGEQLPPLVVNKNYEIIDGRHRKAALELSGRQVADCIIETESDTGTLIVTALKANVGGALPPTKDDIVHSMVLLMNQGWSEKKILDSMPFPRAVSRKYIKNAWGVVLDAKLHAAMKAIADEGLTLKAASMRYDVPEEKLKEHLNPNRKKQNQKTLAWRKQHISRAFQGFHRKMAYEVQHVLDDYDDSKVSEEEVYEFFDHIVVMMTKGEKRISEHRERFANLAREMSKVSAIKIGAGASL